MALNTDALSGLASLAAVNEELGSHKREATHAQARADVYSSVFLL